MPTATSIPPTRPAVQRIGCAGRIVSFQETEDGRYLITLSGLIRFAITRELPLHEGGFRLVEPDFAPFAEDMAERDFEMAAEPEFLAAFKAYFETQAAEGRLGRDRGRARRSPAGRRSPCSRPFSPEEKQSLLECADLGAADGDDDGLVRARGRQPAIAGPHPALRDCAMTDLDAIRTQPRFRRRPEAAGDPGLPADQGHR